MARLTKQTSADLRAAIQAAIDYGLLTPTAILDYLTDNGFEPMPTRMTVIAIMEKCGIQYVSGYWTKTR